MFLKQTVVMKQEATPNLKQRVVPVGIWLESKRKAMRDTLSLLTRFLARESIGQV